MTQDPTRARFPDLAARSGGYESFYVKAAAPNRSRALWIRYTVNQRPHERPRGSMWFTWFDAAADGPVASKVTPDAEPGVDAGEFLHVGEGVFGPGVVRGAAPRDRLEIGWDLTFDGADEALWHLPREWMYSARLPKTKLLSPLPDARVRGSVRIGDRSIELDGWPAMFGHNWGTEHAERWIWLQGTLFDGRGPDTWLDVALGRLKVGPFMTPWIANGALSIDGRRHRIGGIGKARATRVVETPEGCEFTLPGTGLTVSGRVSARRHDLVGWVYADPDGSEHDTRELLHRGSRAPGRPRRVGPPPPAGARVGDLRAGHAGAGPRHPDPAVRGPVGSSQVGGPVRPLAPRVACSSRSGTSRTSAA